MTVIELIWNEGFWFVLILILLFIPIVIRPILNTMGYNKWLAKLTILKGWHRPWKSYFFHIPRLICIRKKVIVKRKVRLISGTLVPFDDDLHTNKLFGFSIGLGVHKHSYRVGWNSDRNGNGRAYVYCYISGSRVYKELNYMEEGKDYYFFISYEKHNKVGITMRNEDFKELGHFEITPGVHCCIGWKLFTYYGDTDRAPRKMKLNISKG